MEQTHEVHPDTNTELPVKVKEEGENIWEHEQGIAITILDGLTDEQRLDVISRYCKYCGSMDSGCQCWNDD